MNLKDFRSQYPQYNDIPDAELAKSLHAKYYSDIPFEEFSGAIGLVAVEEQKQPAAKPFGISAVERLLEPDSVMEGRSGQKATQPAASSNLDSVIKAKTDDERFRRMGSDMRLTGASAEQAQMKEDFRQAQKTDALKSEQAKADLSYAKGMRPLKDASQYKADAIKGIYDSAFQEALDTGADEATAQRRAIEAANNSKRVEEETNRLYGRDALLEERAGRGIEEPTNNLERFGRDFASGELSSVGASFSYIGRRTGFDTLAELGDDLNAYGQDLAPVDQNLADTIANAFGSTASFYIPGAGIRKGTQALAVLSPALAKWAGAGTMAGLEAAAEADGVRKDRLATGASEEEANAAADNAFIANLAILGISDKLAFFNDIKVLDDATGKLMATGAMQSGAAGFATEASQEGLQKITSNYLTNKPLLEGVPESMLVGGLVGGVISPAAAATQAPVISTMVDDRELKRKQADEALGSITGAQSVDEAIAMANTAVNVPLSASTPTLGDLNVSQTPSPTAGPAAGSGPGGIDSETSGANIPNGGGSESLYAVGASTGAGLGTGTGAAVPAVRDTLQPDNAVAPGQVQAKVDVGSGAILTSKGLPFKTETSARTSLVSRGLQEAYEVTPIEGGFAITKKAISEPAPAVAPVQQPASAPVQASMQQAMAEPVVTPQQAAEVPAYDDPVLPQTAASDVVESEQTPKLAAKESVENDQTGTADRDLELIQRGANVQLRKDLIRKQNAGQELSPEEAAGNYLYALEDAPESSLRISPARRLGIRLLASAFGKKVRYIQDRNGKELFFHGVYGGSIGADKNTIFLDAKGDHTLARVAGHEILHAVREQAPDVYDSLVSEVSPFLDAEVAKNELSRRGYPLTDRQGRAWEDQSSEIREETIADLVGDRMVEPKFWLDLAAKMTADKAKRFFDTALSVLTKALKSLSGKPLSSQDKAVVQKAHDSIVKAMAEYKRRIDDGSIAATTEQEDAPAEEMQLARKSRFDVLKREKSSGRYVGAPDWVGSSTSNVTLLYNKLKSLALEGVSGRFWYEKSSKAVLDLVGGDKAEAEKFVGLLAIYSQGTEVGINTGFALEAYYQWKAGLPIRTGRFPTEQSKRAENWLNGGQVWDGIKTNNFYVDLMEEINPAKVDESHATMDMWMALAFDYGSDKLDQGPKYTFAKTMTEILAKELGWKPHQVQAAIWTSIKTRVEATENKRKEVELVKGIAVKNENGKGHKVLGNKKYEHFRLAHKLGMQLKISPEEIAAKGFDFSDAMNARLVQMSWEATPSVSGGTIPGIHRAPIAQKMEYLEAVVKALTEDGKNAVAEAVGLHNPPTLFGVSAWEGQTGAGAQSLFAVPVTGAKKDRAVLPVARELLNDYATLLGLVLRQDAVVWHAPVFDEAESRKNGSELVFNRALSEAEIAFIYQKVYTTFGTWDIAPGYTANGVRLLNFVEGLDNKTFQKGVGSIIESLPADFGGGYVEDRGFRADSAYLSNNWKDNPNGETYQERLRARRPDILERAASLRARVEAVDRRFNEKYGWGETSSTVKFSRKLDGGGSQRAAEPAAGAGTGIGGRPQDGLRGGQGAVSVRGVHYSKEQRQSLDGRYYGTGIRGAEQDRVFSARDRRLKSRLYFYVDEGKGVRPEAGVGRFAHSVDLSNLYDTSSRTLTWEQDPYGDPAVTANNFESAVLDAGYSGYYRPEAFGTQGVAILLGDASHNVQVPTPQFSRKLQETSQLVLMNERVKAKDSWGRHLTSSHLTKVDGERSDVGAKLNTLYIEAAKNKDALDNYLTELASRLGVEVKTAPLKGRARTIEKVMADYNGDVEDMKDVLRATIVTKSMAQARELFEAISESAPIADVKGALKNTLESGSGAGYRDAKVLLDVNGVAAEVIIAPEAMFNAKAIAHGYYEKQRTLAAKRMASQSPKERALIARQEEKLDEVMRGIYLPAAQRAQSSSAVLREHGSALSRTVRELNGLLSGSNAKNPKSISATGRPSKSKNLVSAGSESNGDGIKDTSGDIIPEGDGIRYSRKVDPKVKDWAIRVRDMKAVPQYIQLVASPSLRMEKAGVFRPVVIEDNHVRHALKHDEISIDDIAALPSLLLNPRAAISREDGSIRVLLDARDPNGNPIAAALNPLNVGQGKERLRLTEVSTVFGNEGSGSLILGALLNGNLSYLRENEIDRLSGLLLVSRLPSNVEAVYGPGHPSTLKEKTSNPTDAIANQPQVVSVQTENGRVNLQVQEGARERARELQFSRKNPTGSAFFVGEETNYDAAVRIGQDDQVRWKRQMKALRDRGGVVNEQNDVYQAMERMVARAMNRTEDFYNKEVKPVLQDMQSSNVTMDELGDYLYAIHAKERNAYIKTINPAFANAGYSDVGGSGMSDEEADSIIAAAQAKANFTDLQRFSSTFRSWAEANLNTLVQGGLLTQDQATAMRTRYPNYVPLRGFATGEEADAMFGQGGGFSNAKRAVSRALGRSSKADNPAVYIIHGVAEGMLALEKANVGRYLERLILDNPDEKLWTINQPEKEQLMGAAPKSYEVSYHGTKVAEFANLKDALAYAEPYEVREPGSTSVTTVGGQPQVINRDMGYDPDKEVRFLRDGKEVRIQLKDPLLARAYNNRGSEEIGFVLRASGAINGFLRQMWTQKNPVFPFVNIIRDIPSGLLYVVGEHGFGMAGQMMADIPGAFKAMWQQAGGKKVTNGMDKWVNEYRAAGGGIGFRMVGDIQSSMDRINGLQERLGNGPRGLLMKYVDAVMDFIERINTTFENVTRLAIYKSAREKGHSAAEASRLAKNATVNFNRRGERTPSANALYLFFNASVQDLAKNKRTITVAPHAAEARATLAAIAGLGFALAMLADDEDDLDEENRNINAIRFRVGDTAINIPLSYGLIGFAYYLGRSAALAIKGEDVSKQSLRLASALITNMVPVNPIPNPDRVDLQNAMVGLSPTAVSFPIQVILNRTHFGSDMRPDYNSNPDAYKAFRGTRGSIYADLTALMNESTGGTTRESGLIDISPETLKGMVHFTLGGTGKFVGDSASALTDLADGGEFNMNSVPLVNRFVKTNDVTTYRSRFYRQAGEARTKLELYNKYDKDNNLAKRRELRGWDTLGHRANRMWEDMNELRDKELRVERDPRLSEKERELKLKSLAARQTNIANAFHRMYKKQLEKEKAR